MSTVIMIMLMSIAAAAVILLVPAPVGRERAWLLRGSWALWVLQPALLIVTLLVGLTIIGNQGYSSSNIPDDLSNWLTFAILTTVGLDLLAGTVLGGLALREARREQPPSTRRWFALAALIANALWFGVGVWLSASVPVSVVADVVIIALVTVLLVEARSARHDEPEVVQPAPVTGDSGLSLPDPDRHHVAG